MFRIVRFFPFAVLFLTVAYATAWGTLALWYKKLIDGCGNRCRFMPQLCEQSIQSRALSDGFFPVNPDFHPLPHDPLVHPLSAPHIVVPAPVHTESRVDKAH